MYVYYVVYAQTKSAFENELEGQIQDMWEPVWKSFKHSFAIGPNNHPEERYIVVMRRAVPDPVELCGTCRHRLVLVQPKNEELQYHCLEKEEDMENDEGWCDLYKRARYQ